MKAQIKIKNLNTGDILKWNNHQYEVANINETKVYLNAPSGAYVSYTEDELNKDGFVFYYSNTRREKWGN